MQVYTVFKANNTAHIMMRYEERESLAAKLRDPRFCDDATEATLLGLLFPLLDGLAVVHAVDLIHRGIKPDNVFIRKDSEPGAARFRLRPLSERKPSCSISKRRRTRMPDSASELRLTGIKGV